MLFLYILNKPLIGGSKTIHSSPVNALSSLYAVFHFVAGQLKARYNNRLLQCVTASYTLKYVRSCLRVSMDEGSCFFYQIILHEMNLRLCPRIIFFLFLFQSFLRWSSLHKVMISGRTCFLIMFTSYSKSHGLTQGSFVFRAIEENMS